MYLSITFSSLIVSWKICKKLLHKLILICFDIINKAENSPTSLKKKRKAYKIIIIIFEDQMDTSSNDFQAELPFGFRVLKTTLCI